MCGRALLVRWLKESSSGTDTFQGMTGRTELVFTTVKRARNPKLVLKYIRSFLFSGLIDSALTTSNLVRNRIFRWNGTDFSGLKRRVAVLTGFTRI